MNHLAVCFIPSQLEDGAEYQGLRLLIDGKNLIDLARDAERPFAEREGHPKLAGAYSWLPSSHKTSMLPESMDAEKVALLRCPCGDLGCWPLLATIGFGTSQVTWSDFEQPHRSQDSAAGHWQYLNLGPFTFSREQYERELRRAA